MGGFGVAAVSWGMGGALGDARGKHKQRKQEKQGTSQCRQEKVVRPGMIIVGV